MTFGGLPRKPYNGSSQNLPSARSGGEGRRCFWQGLLALAGLGWALLFRFPPNIKGSIQHPLPIGRPNPPNRNHKTRITRATSLLCPRGSRLRYWLGPAPKAPNSVGRASTPLPTIHQAPIVSCAYPALHGPKDAKTIRTFPYESDVRIGIASVERWQRTSQNHPSTHSGE